jgi:hypothetical protein
MELIENWKLILKKAWSLRLLTAAAVLSGAESIAPFAQNYLPPRLFAATMFAIVCLAFAARLLAQKEVSDE